MPTVWQEVLENSSHVPHRRKERPWGSDRSESLLSRYLPFLSADQPLEHEGGLRDVGPDSLGTPQTEC
ncbi:hypothetical protein ACF09Y_24765 [Streptomyces massasporeus]|uniref:hypothetical protein n=1 Tax=Streptomyces massasporeus TaxID=67324 RepID=UPI0036F5B8BC